MCRSEGSVTAISVADVTKNDLLKVVDVENNHTMWAKVVCVVKIQLSDTEMVHFGNCGLSITKKHPVF